MGPALWCSLLMLCQGGGGKPNDDGFGRPPILPVEHPGIRPPVLDLNPPPSTRGDPDRDDVQVSTPSNGNQNELVMRMSPVDRDHLIGGANDDRRGPYTCAFYASQDGGETWNEFLYNPPAGYSAGDPAAAFGPAGEVYFCPLAFAGDSQIFVGQSFDGGISVPSWNLAVPKSSQFHDKQYMVGDTTASALSGALYVSWTRFSSSFSSYPIYVTASFDQGLTWSTQQRLSDSSHCQGSCPAVGPNGELYVAFLNFDTNTMDIDVSLDGGQTWGTDVTVGSVRIQLDNAPFRFNAFPVVDVDTTGGPFDGRVYVCYSTYVQADGANDVVLYWSDDGAQTFNGPVRVSDDTDQTSQFFPWMDVDSLGNVNVGFYDRRGGSGQDQVIGYRVARSSDGGVTFDRNRRVADQKFDPWSYGDGGFIGDYTGLAASDRTVHPFWTDGRNATNDAYTSRVQLDCFTNENVISAATGGVVDFTVNVGPVLAGANYWIFGSISGTVPGIDFPTGVNLPVNYDAMFQFTLRYANSPVLKNFRGVLDASGTAAVKPQLDTQGPLDPALVGLHVDFSALILRGGTVVHATNPTGIDITP